LFFAQLTGRYQPAKLALEAAVLLNNLRSWQVSVYAIIICKFLRPLVNNVLVKNLRFEPVVLALFSLFCLFLGAL
jgi:hypothetical protein